MELTAAEQRFLSEVGQQVAAGFIAAGITEPTPEQINSAFIARCQRNIEIASQYINRAPWAKPMREALAIDIYRDAHMVDLIERTR